jgi:hypothetical protein
VEWAKPDRLTPSTSDLVDPVKIPITLTDLNAVTTDPDLFTQGRYYFTGIWQQAAQAPTGQQAILRAIAPDPAGLSHTTLLHHAQLDETALDAAIAALLRHDVVHAVNEKWCIKVELFRRWVIRLPA